VGDLVEKFGSLAPATQKSIVKWLAIAAVAGPVILAIGKMTTAVLTLRAAMVGTAAVKGLAGLAGAAGGLPGVAAGAGGAFPGVAGAGAGGAAAAAGGVSAATIGAIVGTLVAAGAVAVIAQHVVGEWAMKNPDAVTRKAQLANAKYGAPTVGTGRATVGNVEAWQARQAGSTARTLEQVIIDLEMRGGGNKALNEAMEAIKLLRTEAAKDIDFTLDPKKPLASLQSIQARLMGLGMDGKTAFSVLKSVFGKDVVAPFRSNLLGIIPAMSKAKAAVLAKHREMAAKLMGKIRMGGADNSAVLAAIEAVISRMKALGYSAGQAAAAVQRALRPGSGAAKGATIDSIYGASGGVWALNSAQRFVFGEGGAEVAAAFPLNDPARSSALYSALGAMLGERFGGRSQARPASTGSSGGASGGGVIHVHNYIDGAEVSECVLDMSGASDEAAARSFA
jgi:hypothetical protein